MATFLDTKVIIKNNHIITDLYQKPTDSHNYLMYDSAHPQSCKDSIPYSQLLRIRWICSEESDFLGHCFNLIRHFTQRGYPLKLLEESLFHAQQHDRIGLLQYKKPDQSPDQNKLFLTTTYHPHDSRLRDIVRNNWDILGKNNTTNYLHNKKLVCGFRRPKNLRDTLMRAKIPPLESDKALNPFHIPKSDPPPPVQTTRPKTQKSITDFFKQGPSATPPLLGPKPKPLAGTKPKPRGFKFCQTRGCNYCPLLDKSGELQCSKTNEKFYTMVNISCRSSNLIYCITCKICNIQYVGQTSRRIKDRFAGHFHDIKSDKIDKSIPYHFNSKNHGGIKDLKISVLEFIKKPPSCAQAQSLRLKREQQWVHTLRTLAPHGLNWENPKEYKLPIK